MDARDMCSWIYGYIISRRGLFESPPSTLLRNRSKSAPAPSIPRPPPPHGMSWNCISDLWSVFGDGPGTDLKLFPPAAHSPQGTPAVQTTHFQFHPHPVDLVLTYRKGLNTGLTPGQMPLASKQPGQGPPKSLPLTWEKTTDLKWHLHIQSSSCINVNLMSANKWYQSATTTRCPSALPALCKCASLVSLSPETAFLGDSFHCRVLENISHRVEGGGGKTKYHNQVQLIGIRQYKQLKLVSVFLKYTTFTLQYHIYHRLLIPLVQVEFKRNTFTSSTPSHSLIYSVIQQIFADFLYMQSSVESPISITTNPDIYNNSNFQLQPFRECII